MDELIKEFLKTHKMDSKNDNFAEAFTMMHADIILTFKQFKDKGLNNKVYSILLASSLSGIALDSTSTIDEAIGVLKRSIKMLEELENEAVKEN